MTSSFVSMLISNLLAGLSGFIGIFNFFTLREALMMVVMISPLSVWTWRVIDIAFMILLGIVWLIMVIMSQSGYDKAFKNKTLPRAFCLVTGYQALVFFFTSMIIHILDFLPATSSGILLTVLKAVVSVCLLFFVYKDVFLKKLKQSI